MRTVRQLLDGKRPGVFTIDVEEPVRTAIQLMADHFIGALPVLEGGRLAGIVSERDVVRALASHGAATLGRTVASAMSAAVVTCRPDDSVDELMSSMTERRIRHLPVVDDDGLLTGIVSIGDVVKARLGQLQGENEALTEYIHQGR